MTTPNPWRPCPLPLGGTIEIPAIPQAILASMTQAVPAPILYVTDDGGWTIVAAWSAVRNVGYLESTDADATFSGTDDALALVDAPFECMDQLTSIREYLASNDSMEVPRWWAIETQSHADTDWGDRICQLFTTGTFRFELQSVSHAHPPSRFLVFEFQAQSVGDLLQFGAPTKLGEGPGHLKKRSDWFQRREKDSP